MPVPITFYAYLAHEEIAGGVHPVSLHQVQRIDHVAGALRDFLAVLGPPPVHEKPLRGFQTRRKEERRPVDGVEPEDVLADHVEVRRPKPGINVITKRQKRQKTTNT